MRLGLVAFGLGPKTLTEIAGATGTFGAAGAPDIGLIFQKSAHCDGADTLQVSGYPQSAAQANAQLRSCRAWIFEKIDAAIDNAC